MSRRAEKILERMRQTKTGWRSKDFHTLYLGFGFIKKSGKGGHDVFIHPAYRYIRDTIPNHSRELSPAYARDAVRNIDHLLRLEEEQGSDE